MALLTGLLRGKSPPKSRSAGRRKMAATGLDVEISAATAPPDAGDGSNGGPRRQQVRSG